MLNLFFTLYKRSLATRNTVNTKTFAKYLGDKILMSVGHFYVRLDFDVSGHADSRHTESKGLSLVDLGLFDSFTEVRFTIISEDRLQKVEHPHLATPMYEL